MPENISRMLSRRTVFEGGFLRFVLTRYTDSFGVEREWESVERINCNGIVVIVPLTDDLEFLLIRQFRPPVNSYVIEFPAGLNDKGDTLQEAARRELLEETGYAAREMIHLADGPMSAGSSGEILTCYLAKGLEFIGIRERDETEEIEVIKVPAGELGLRLSELKADRNLVDLKIYGLADLATRLLNS